MQASKQQVRQLGRITKRDDFLKINKDGKKWVSQSLVLQALPNSYDKIRVGFTVTKKTDASAVNRNRMKRRLRAAAADILPQHAAPAHDYVLIARAAAAERPYDTLCKDLKWCLEKMGCGKGGQ